jgi:hypothetical protein
MEKKIIVQWFDCSEEKKKMFGYDKEMFVIESNHSRFVKGTRFDFGFLQVANREGYTVEVRP